MSGYVAMSRRWQDHDLFAGDVYSRRDAWAWLIAEAAWRQKTVTVGRRQVVVERGQLTHSVRFLSDKWGWSKSAVARFLAKLQSEKMVEIRQISSGTDTGTVLGTVSGTVQSVITICNYDKFQSPLDGKRDSFGDSAWDSERDKEEPNKPKKEEEGCPPRGGSSYHFEGKVIRLTKADFDQWASSYSLLDLRAVLQSRDDWLANEAPDKIKSKWFIPTSNYLAKLQQKAAAEEREPAWDGMA